MSVRVIIADDHALWRAGLRQLLEAEGLEVAGEAATGDEALEAVRAKPGAVLLLDLAMPGRLDGLATSARLKERGDDVKVIIVSGRDDRDALFSSITAGARGYIAKDAEPAQLDRRDPAGGRRRQRLWRLGRGGPRRGRRRARLRARRVRAAAS